MVHCLFFLNDRHNSESVFRLGKSHLVDLRSIQFYRSFAPTQLSNWTYCCYFCALVCLSVILIFQHIQTAVVNGLCTSRLFMRGYKSIWFDTWSTHVASGSGHVSRHSRVYKWRWRTLFWATGGVHTIRPIISAHNFRSMSKSNLPRTSFPLSTHNALSTAAVVKNSWTTRTASPSGGNILL